MRRSGYGRGRGGRGSGGGRGAPAVPPACDRGRYCRRTWCTFSHPPGWNAAPVLLAGGCRDWTELRRVVSLMALIWGLHSPQGCPGSSPLLSYSAVQDARQHYSYPPDSSRLSCLTRFSEGAGVPEYDPCHDFIISNPARYAILLLHRASAHTTLAGGGATLILPIQPRPRRSNPGRYGMV